MQAFPFLYLGISNGQLSYEDTEYYPGMSKREVIATVAAHAMLTASLGTKGLEGRQITPYVVGAAIEFADAFLAELAKE